MGLIEAPENISISITESNELELSLLNCGQATVKLKALSNGKTTEKTIIMGDITTSIQSVEIDNNLPVEYYNMQGLKVENPSNGIFIKKQGANISKVIL